MDAKGDAIAFLKPIFKNTKTLYIVFFTCRGILIYVAAFFIYIHNKIDIQSYLLSNQLYFINIS